MGHNEDLIRQAIQGRRNEVVLSVKFGAMRGPDGAWIGPDTRPAAVRNSIANSLRRLGVETIDLYTPARVDPAVPIEDTVGALADLVKQGYVRYVGLSEAGVKTIRRAHAAHPITALQIEYSLDSRDIEDHVLPAVREMGIGIVAQPALARRGHQTHLAPGENLNAANVQLSPADLARLEAALPRGGAAGIQAKAAFWLDAGDRYPAPMMPHLIAEVQ